MIYYWLAGTYLPALTVPFPVATALAADGQWHHYEIDFTDIVIANNLTVTLQAATVQNFGSAAHPMQTDVTTIVSLSTAAGNGSQFVNEANSATVTSMNAGTSQLSCVSDSPIAPFSSGTMGGTT